MKIYQKIKARHPVDRLFVVKKSSNLRNFRDNCPEEGLQLMPRFAIEFNRTCLMLVTLPDKEKLLGAEEITISLFNHRGKLVKRMNLYQWAAERPAVSNAVIDVIGEIHAAQTTSQPTPDLDSGRMVIWEPKGDSHTYRRIKPVEAREHLGNFMAEIIRRRDHAVRGHWRTLKNGKRVWVKAHRRGDEALGTVTAVQEIG